MKEILSASNIPLENMVYRLLYAYTLAFKRKGNNILNGDDLTNFTHDEARGCLFDMNGIKTDVVYSCHSPIVCSSCIEGLRAGTVSNEVIARTQKEIKKPLFFQIADFVKKHPMWSLLASAVAAIVLGGVGSYIAAVIYEYR